MLSTDVLHSIKVRGGGGGEEEDGNRILNIQKLNMYLFGQKFGSLEEEGKKTKKIALATIRSSLSEKNKKEKHWLVIRLF